MMYVPTVFKEKKVEGKTKYDEVWKGGVQPTENLAAKVAHETITAMPKSFQGCFAGAVLPTKNGPRKKYFKLTISLGSPVPHLNARGVVEGYKVEEF